MLIHYFADVERDASMKNLSTKEALEILNGMKVKTEIPKAAVMQYERNMALDMAIEALKYSEIPNSLDCISRQAAIDALQKEINKGKPPFDDVIGSIRCGVRLARNIIEDLPSAQSEIIRCKDCKFYREYGYVNGKHKFLLRCGFNQIYVNGEDFCSRAERREK